MCEGWNSELPQSNQAENASNVGEEVHYTAIIMELANWFKTNPLRDS